MGNEFNPHVKTYIDQCAILLEGEGKNCCFISCNNCIIYKSHLEFFSGRDRFTEGYKAIQDSPCADPQRIIDLCTKYLYGLKIKKMNELLNER